MFEQPIQLIHGQDGVVVILPRSYSPTLFTPDTFRMQAKIYREELHKDDLLDNIMSEHEQKEAAPVRPFLQDNVHVFKTFGESVSFLNQFFK